MYPDLAMELALLPPRRRDFGCSLASSRYYASPCSALGGLRLLHRPMSASRPMTSPFREKNRIISVYLAPGLPQTPEWRPRGCSEGILPEIRTCAIAFDARIILAKRGLRSIPRMFSGRSVSLHRR